MLLNTTIHSNDVYVVCARMHLGVKGYIESAKLFTKQLSEA